MRANINHWNAVSVKIFFKIQNSIKSGFKTMYYAEQWSKFQANDADFPVAPFGWHLDKSLRIPILD